VGQFQRKLCAALLMNLAHTAALAALAARPDACAVEVRRPRVSSCLLGVCMLTVHPGAPGAGEQQQRRGEGGIMR